MALKTGFLAGALAGVGLAAVAAAGVGLKWPETVAEPARAPLIPAVAPAGAPPGGPQSFADIFERVAPAVVSIDVTSRIDPRTLGIQALPFPFNLPPGLDGDEGDDTPQATPAPRGRGGSGSGSGSGSSRSRRFPEAQATGSGFFISPDGYIVTNNHVVENAESITVRLNDKRELKARVVGRDPNTDLAVVKVEGANFPYVSFETQARPRVGDWVLAVGNPYNLGGTATAGIISAYGRDIGDQFVDYLQIDAPINRGNSGGPTFDVYGRVIGVNTAIFSPSGGSVGIGFAIPADIADSVTRQLMAGRTVARGYLGVSIQSITKDIADSLGIKANEGALVGDVIPGGPGDKAGLKSFDVIVSVDGHPVTSASELTRNVAAAKPGELIRLRVLREGRPIEIVARSGTRPSEAELNKQNGGDEGGSTAPNGGGKASPAEPSVLGLRLAPLDEAARRRFGIGSTVRGVVVEGVAPGSSAADLGLKRGDVIVQVGQGRPANTPADVQAAVAEARKAGRPSVLLLVSRDGRTVFAPLKLDSK